LNARFIQTRLSRFLPFTATVMLLSLAATVPVRAQDYPVRPIRIILPFSPGGGTDLLARLLGQRFHDSFGQAVTVDNRAGAGGNIGADLTAKSAPDGYTLMLSTASLAVNVTLYPKLPFDARKDLIAITQIASSPVVLTMHPTVPARSVKELVALSKKARGGLTYASGGNGTTSHLAGVLLQQVSGMQLIHVPYKGAGAQMTAQISGEVEVGFSVVISALPHLRTGKLRALAVTTKRKSSALPDVPTVDASYPGFDIDNWYGFYAPAATPAAIVNRIHATVVQNLQHPDVKAFMQREGAEPVGSSPAEFTAFFSGEIDKFAKIVKSSGAKPDS
jgi:tripartite-type tricarboxylate transporter receptor subunit TctC